MTLNVSFQCSLRVCMHPFLTAPYPCVFSHPYAGFLRFEFTAVSIPCHTMSECSLTIVLFSPTRHVNTMPHRARMLADYRSFIFNTPQSSAALFVCTDYSTRNYGAFFSFAAGPLRARFHPKRVAVHNPQHHVRALLQERCVGTAERSFPGRRRRRRVRAASGPIRARHNDTGELEVPYGSLLRCIAHLL